MTFYILTILGIISSLFWSVGTFNKATPAYTTTQSIKAYFKLNLFYGVAGWIIALVVCFLLQVPGGEKLISLFTTLESNSPVYAYLAAFGLGIFSDMLSTKVRSLFKPIAIDTRTLQESPKP